MAATEKNNLQLPGIPKKMGRPVTGKALSNAERQARHRANVKMRQRCALESTEQQFQRLNDDFLIKSLKNDELEYKAWLELGRRRGWLK